MATTGIWKVSSNIKQVIDYTTNKEKTYNEEFLQTMHKVAHHDISDYQFENLYYVSAINCSVETAYEEMLITKKSYSKTDGILAFHGFQSFKEGEVSPSIAHEIGVKLAEEMWGDRFEVVISTHTNTNHIHNHFVINSVSFKDGKRYYDKRSTYAELRHISDCLCSEYGLSVLEEKPCRNSKINYANYYKGSVARSTYHSIAKEDIDKAIEQAYDYKDFINLMRAMDYEVINRYGKLSVRRYPYKRNIRIERSFGSDYSIENIQKRIELTYGIRQPLSETRDIYKIFVNKKENKRKIKGIYGLYLYYCYLLKVFPQEFPAKRLPPSIRIDVEKMDKISDEAKMLVEKNIETYEQLTNYKDIVNEKLCELKGKRELLWQKHKRVHDTVEKTKIIEIIQDLNIEINEYKKHSILCDDVIARLPIMKSKVKLIDKEYIEKEMNKDEFIK